MVDVVIKISETMSPDEIAVILSNISHIDVNDMTIGVEYDENGKICHIIVYVKEEKQAQIMKEAVESFCKSGSYERACEEPTIQETAHESALSCGYVHHFQTTMTLFFFALILIALS